MAGMDFGAVDPNAQFAGGELIAKGTLAWGVINFRWGNADQGVAETTSKNPGKDGNVSKYLDSIVTITEGPHAKRKVFHKIGIVGSPVWTAAGGAAIRHILETGNNASPSNPAGYQIPTFFQLDGMRVAVEIGVESGGTKQDGTKFDDKNAVSRFLSGNPASDTHKTFLRLQAGDTQPKTPPAGAGAKAPQAPAWGGGPVAPAAVAPVAPAAPAGPAAATGSVPWGKPAWTGAPVAPAS